MGLVINNGKLCCSCQLCQGRICGSGTLGSVYAPCPPAGATNTFFNTADDTCYTVASTDTVTGQTPTPTLRLIGPGNDCNDSRCLCLPCDTTHFPSSLIVGGLSGTISTTDRTTWGQTNSCQDGCSSSLPGVQIWDGLMSQGVGGGGCYGCGDCGSPGQNLILAGGGCIHLGGATLSCVDSLPDSGAIGWQITFTGINLCGGFAGWSATYEKVGGYPTGTYSLISSSSTGSSLNFPLSITVS